jgi:hypothetical protein
MKTLLAAILLASLTTVQAEPKSRQVRFMCGSYEELKMTTEKYGENLVLVSLSPDERVENYLYVNFQTSTSSWIIHDRKTDDYCMMGVGELLYIPDDSPLKDAPIGEKV